MSALDELTIKLLIAKQQLRQYEEASADARNAAHEPQAEFSSEEYLKSAEHLDCLAAEQRKEIEDLTKALDELRRTNA